MRTGRCRGPASQLPWVLLWVLACGFDAGAAAGLGAGLAAGFATGFGLGFDGAATEAEEDAAAGFDAGRAGVLDVDAAEPPEAAAVSPAAWRCSFFPAFTSVAR